MFESLVIKDSRGVNKLVHPSTCAAMALISQLEFPAESFNVLDIGTGSGILAMLVARKTPHANIIAGDISALAVEEALENIRNNELVEQVCCVQAAGMDHPLIRQMEPFHLIMANLLAEFHVQYLVGIEQALNENGVVILSGILVWRMQEIEAALAFTGFRIVERIDNGGWVTVRLSK